MIFQNHNNLNFYIIIAAMSENYVVFIEQPIKMDLLKIVTGKLCGKGINEGVYWDPKQNTVFHVINKRTGKVNTSINAYFMLHHDIFMLFYLI